MGRVYLEFSLYNRWFIMVFGAAETYQVKEHVKCLVVLLQQKFIDVVIKQRKYTANGQIIFVFVKSAFASHMCTKFYAMWF